MNRFEIQLEIKKGCAVFITLPAHQSGRFRYKESGSFGFGSCLSKDDLISASSYLEWQIGYDRVASESNSIGREDPTFVGANGKIKVPYELGDILKALFDAKLLDASDFDKCERHLESISKSFLSFYGTHEPKIRKLDKPILIDGLSSQWLESYEIVLPAYRYSNAGLWAEISLQKQQRGSDMWPMLYVCIPADKLFYKDGEEVLKDAQRRSAESICNFKITKNSARFFVDLVLIFGFLSEDHNKDIASILSILNSYVAP